MSGSVPRKAMKAAYSRLGTQALQFALNEAVARYNDCARARDRAGIDAARTSMELISAELRRR